MDDLRDVVLADRPADLVAKSDHVASHVFDASPADNLVLRVLSPSRSALVPSRDYLRDAPGGAAPGARPRGRRAHRPVRRGPRAVAGSAPEVRDRLADRGDRPECDDALPGPRLLDPRRGVPRHDAGPTWGGLRDRSRQRTGSVGRTVRRPAPCHGRLAAAGGGRAAAARVRGGAAAVVGPVGQAGRVDTTAHSGVCGVGAAPRRSPCTAWTSRPAARCIATSSVRV